KNPALDLAASSFDMLDRFPRLFVRNNSLSVLHNFLVLSVRFLHCQYGSTSHEGHIVLDQGLNFSGFVSSQAADLSHLKSRNSGYSQFVRCPGVKSVHTSSEKSRPT